MYLWINEEKIEAMKESAFMTGWILGCALTGIGTIAFNFFITR